MKFLKTVFLSLLIGEFYCYGLEEFLTSEVSVEKEGANLDESKNLAIAEGKKIALESYLKESGNEIRNLSASLIDECIDSYTIKSEKFIGNIYQADISYNIDQNVLNNFLNRKSNRNSKAAYSNGENWQYVNENPFAMGKKLIVIPTDNPKNMLKFLEARLGFQVFNSLYSISSNFVKIRNSQGIVEHLKARGMRFSIELSE